MTNHENIIEQTSYELSVKLPFVIRNLVYVLLFILFFYALGQIAKFYFGRDTLLGFVPMFNLYGEANLPTWFSSIILIISSALLLIIATAKRFQHDRWFYYWAGLSAAFLFLSIDESAKLHEAAGRVFQHIVGEFLIKGEWSMWVVPFGVLALIFAGAYVRFLFALKPYYRYMFVLSGLIYVSGALGMEVVEILYVRGAQMNNGIFMMMVTVEEVMEMGGIILFIYVLLRYIEENIGKFSVAVRN